MIINLLTALFIFTVLSSSVTQAQEILTNEVLKHKIQLRDKAMIELLERVEMLEQRVGVESTKNNEKSSKISQQDVELVNAQAPGAVVVKEGDAERALERSLTVEGALLLPVGILELDTGITFIRQEDGTSGFFMENNQTFPSEIELNSDILSANIGLRLGLPWDSQLEMGLPYRLRKSEVVTRVNFEIKNARTSDLDKSLGDASIGLAKTFLRERLWLPDLVGRVTWDTDSGEGDGFHEFRGSLSGIKRQDPVTFIGGISYQHSLKNKGIQPGAGYSANFSSLIGLSPETSMRFSINGFYQHDTERDGKVLIGSKRKIASFSIGGSTLLYPGTLLNLSFGVGLTDDADDFSVTVSLPIRLGRKLF